MLQIVFKNLRQGKPNRTDQLTPCSVTKLARKTNKSFLRPMFRLVPMKESDNEF